MSPFQPVVQSGIVYVKNLVPIRGPFLLKRKNLKLGLETRMIRPLGLPGTWQESYQKSKCKKVFNKGCVCVAR